MTPSSPARHGLAFDCDERRQHGLSEALDIASECGEDMQTIARRLRFQLLCHGDLLPPIKRQAIWAAVDTCAALAPLLAALASDAEEPAKSA